MMSKVEIIDSMLSSNERVVVGVVSDTHVPDRAAALHPALIPTLMNERVNLILHLGDICVPSVLHQLGKIGHVFAVRGNRDWLFAGRLPWQRNLEIAGVRISLQHGQGSFWDYWLGKLFHMASGYQVENYLPRLIKASPNASVILFGHTHYPECLYWEGRLVMNPGSANVGNPIYKNPTIGVLSFSVDRKVSGKIVELKPG